VNRNQRRLQEKQNKKSTSVENTSLSSLSSLEEKLNNINSDLSKIVKYNQNLEFKINVIMETLLRKNILIFDELRETENFYINKPKEKFKKIKELFQKELTLKEILLAIKEDPYSPGYLKFNIDPVLDLNVNPYELAQFLRDEYPDKSNEEVFDIGNKLYNLKKSHFGIED